MIMHQNNRIMTGQSIGWSIAPGVTAWFPPLPNVICGYDATHVC